MIKIFVSGPYTLGDTAINVKNAMDLTNKLIDMGFAPYCAHLTHFLHMNKPQEYKKWLALDLEYLKLCDGLIRMKGKSNGADMEVDFAKKNDIPVFYSLRELANYKFLRSNSLIG